MKRFNIRVSAFVIFVVIPIFSHSVIAQQTIEEKINSYLKEYEELKSDDLFLALQRLGKAVEWYGSLDAEKAQYWTDTAVEIGDTTTDASIKSAVQMILGDNAKIKNNFDSAIEHFTKSIELIKPLNNEGFIRSILIKIGTCYSAIGKFKDAIRIYEELLESLFKQPPNVNTQKRISHIYDKLGIAHFRNGSTNKALENYDKAIEFAQKSQADNIQFYYANKGNALAFSGQYKQALETFLNAVTYAEKTQNKGFLAHLYLSIRKTLNAMEDYDGFFTYGEKSMALFRELSNKEGILKILSSDIPTYISLKRYNKALEICDSALIIAREINDNDTWGDIFEFKGSAHFQLKEYSKAEEYLKKAVETAVRHDIKANIRSSKYVLGKVYAAQGQYYKALPLLETAHNLAANNGALTVLYPIQQSLSEVYYNLGMNRQAYEMQHAYVTLKDSLINEENIRKTAQMESEFNFEKEKEILAAEQAKQEAVLKAESQRNLFIAIGIGIFALLASFFFWNTRRKNKIIVAQNNQLENLNQTKDRIFAILGHDLRKPAIAFQGLSKTIDYLIEQKDYDTLSKIGKELQRDANSLHGLTDNILNWALTQREVVPYHPILFDLNEEIEEVLQIFQRPLEEKNIQLNNQSEGEIIAHADPNSVATIIRNLVDNAVKYTPKGGQISLTSEENSNQICLKITDSGNGISPEKIAEIFKLNSDKSQGGTAGEKGTGLGLHLVRELVKVNHGEIRMNSKVGEGTTVEIWLPKAA